MKKQNWYEILSSDLLNAAYKTKGGELAWPEEQALQVLGLLNTSNYVLIAVEPWLPTIPGPTPLIFDWEAKPRTNKMPRDPSEFILQFENLHPGKLDQKPVFNFCVK